MTITEYANKEDQAIQARIQREGVSFSEVLGQYVKGELPKDELGEFAKQVRLRGLSPKDIDAVPDLLARIPELRRQASDLGPAKAEQEVWSAAHADIYSAWEKAREANNQRQISTYKFMPHPNSMTPKDHEIIEGLSKAQQATADEYRARLEESLSLRGPLHDRVCAAQGAADELIRIKRHLTGIGLEMPGYFAPEVKPTQ